MSDYYYDLESGELYHYGVLGMKWGVHKAARKERRNDKYTREAIGYDKSAADLRKKAEKEHAKNDLGQSNRAAVKSAKYAKKAAKYAGKAHNTDSDRKRDRYTAKSETLKYKSAKANIKGESLAKTAGYGSKAIKLSTQADSLEAKAAKARMRVAKNTRYINKIERKTSSLSNDQIDAAKSWIKGWDVDYSS